MAESTDPALLAEMKDVFTAYEAVWNDQAFGRLRDFWDPDADPLYLAEEQPDWRTGWDALDSYFVSSPGQPSYVEALLMRYRVTAARELAPGLVQVVGWIRHDMKMVGPMKAWGGDCRMTAVLRRTPQGWRFVSYAEAHMTPLTYVQRLYELNVSPEFEPFLREVERKRAERGIAEPVEAPAQELAEAGLTATQARPDA